MVVELFGDAEGSRWWQWVAEKWLKSWQQSGAA